MTIIVLPVIRIERDGVALHEQDTRDAECVLYEERLKRWKQFVERDWKELQDAMREYAG